MTNQNPSWADLRIAADTAPKKIVRRLQMLSVYGAEYDKFCDAIEDALDFAVKKAVEHKNIINPNSSISGRMDENQITAYLSMALLGMCFDIAHSKNVGGNCDITITGSHEMLWLGEAKIFTSYPKALGGYQQLCDRYATGLGSQNRGGFLIYHFRKNSGGVLENWKEHLNDARPGIAVESTEHAHIFKSTESHAGTGLDYHVRHMIVPLFHSPTDSAAKPAKASRK